MTAIVIREGEFIRFDEEYGYLYKLNASLYAYKNGTTRLLGEIKS